eukprot:TRINITY_DN9658_c0_g1_i1.p1 TRINITY_DN9658_c0_g1~~TRINITY_DN9658_c0_g1_i1.p1  ORF type:complete len:393 (-),score=95.91 TRINITY_DN9658_c0_g1_i1:88-1266(-)
MATVRRKLHADDKGHDPIAEFIKNRETRLQDRENRKASKQKKDQLQMQKIASGSGSPLAHSGSAVLLGRRMSNSGGPSKNSTVGSVKSEKELLECASRESSKDRASKAFNVARRQWTVDVCTQEDEDNILSPKWTKPVVRKAFNRLSVEAAVNLSRAATLEDAADGEDEEDASSEFVDISGKLHNLVNQAVMRTVKFFAKIRANHKENPAVLQEKQNFERLCSVSFLIATTNYHMSKWLWQLKPASYVKPKKPVDTVDEHRMPDELLGEVQFNLARMELLASDLMHKLQQILSDAKAQSENPRYLHHVAGADDEPLTPGCANPVRLARKRGIRDVREMQGMMGHLERLLEVAHSLAYKPAGVAQVKVTATIILAAARFKKGLQLRKARNSSS